MREYQRTVRHLKDRDKLRQPIERAQGRSKYVASEQHLLYALCRWCAQGLLNIQRSQEPGRTTSLGDSAVICRKLMIALWDCC
jgi:hypothetical protein